MATRQIVAMGGGGFLVAGDDGVLDDYVLSLTRKCRARVCFLATANGDGSALPPLALEMVGNEGKWSWRTLRRRNPILRSHYEQEERGLWTPFRPG